MPPDQFFPIIYYKYLGVLYVLHSAGSYAAVLRPVEWDGKRGSLVYVENISTNLEGPFVRWYGHLKPFHSHTNTTTILLAGDYHPTVLTCDVKLDHCKITYGTTVTEHRGTPFTQE